LDEAVKIKEVPFLVSSMAIKDRPAWFMQHAALVLEELKQQDEIQVARLTPRRKEVSAKNGGLHPRGVSVPAAYGS
jgi:hypothetical protein